MEATATHSSLERVRAQRAAQYPHGLCKSILDATAIVRRHRDGQRAHALEGEGIHVGGCGAPSPAREVRATEPKEALHLA